MTWITYSQLFEKYGLDSNAVRKLVKTCGIKTERVNRHQLFWEEDIQSKGNILGKSEGSTVEERKDSDPPDNLVWVDYGTLWSKFGVKRGWLDQMIQSKNVRFEGDKYYWKDVERCLSNVTLVKCLGER